MMNKLKELIGIKPPVDYAQIVKEGGIIIDVRTKAEYAGGHIKGSKNIPLQSLNDKANISKNKDSAIITCCASGMRSASAKSFLRSKGYTNVHNGGSWSNLNSKISS
jgi:phage shock protein E